MNFKGHEQMMQKMPSIMAILLLGPFWTSTRILGIETAGELFVDLDAATLSPGDTVWENVGTYSDFVAVGTPMSFDYEFHLDRGLIRTQPAVYFHEDSAFVGLDPTPNSLIGNEPRSIEVWAYRIGFGGAAYSDPLVAWGKWGVRQDGEVVLGGDMLFGAGESPVDGAAIHFSPDLLLGWSDDTCMLNCVPAAFMWHHLVYTYDGEVVRVYSDGELWNEKDLIQFGGLNTDSDTSIAIAGHWNSEGTIFSEFLAPHRSFLSRVRVHDGVLTADQIASNYDEEKRDYPETTPGFRDFSVQIDPMQRAIKSSTFHPFRDLNNDLVVDLTDQALMRSNWGIWLGDANSDREFNSSDLVSVFAAGQFEDNDPEAPETIMNSTWREGDWNADGDFDTSDFVVAFQEGGYERGPRPRELLVVPESVASWPILLVGLISCFRTKHKSKSVAGDSPSP